jgi:sugar/nucleoside kinase (ribokinase family)
LANIDPDLQRDVLGQLDSPGFVACDTMNFWISTKKKSLRKLLKNIDLFLANDSEARQFSGETNLFKAAGYILSMGPRMVIIKKGEHGSIFVSEKEIFVVPGFPLEVIHDPTGAGDTFACGLMGYLSSRGRASSASIRRALLLGGVMASFNVERFSIEGLLKLNKRLINKRYGEYRDFTRV